MHNEALGTLQAHPVALQGLHIVVPRFELAGPTRKAVEELEHCIVGDGIPEMIAIYESVQTIHDDVEEWVQWGKSSVLFATHHRSPMGLFSLRPNVRNQRRSWRPLWIEGLGGSFRVNRSNSDNGGQEEISSPSGDQASNSAIRPLRSISTTPTATPSALRPRYEANSVNGFPVSGSASNVVPNSTVGHLPQPQRATTFNDVISEMRKGASRSSKLASKDCSFTDSSRRCRMQ